MKFAPGLLLLFLAASSFAQCIALWPINEIAVTHGAPLTLAAADLNGDGTDEFIIGSAAKILWNDGAGSYSLEDVPGPFARTGSPPSFATGDTDGSPGDELAIADDLGVRLLAKRRDGSWSRIDYSVTGTPLGIGIADVAGDARGEVLVVNSDKDQTRLSVFSGQSAELLFTRDIARSAYYYFDNVDVDHDGRLDLVVTGSGTWSRLPHDYWPIENGFISIFLRGSDSLSAEKRLVDGQALMRPLFADFDGDGIADLLVGRYFRDFLFFPGKPEGGFGLAMTYAAGDGAWGITYYAAADFDGDGIADLARVRGDPPDLITIYRGSREGLSLASRFHEPWLWAPPVVARTKRESRSLVVPTYDGRMIILAPAPCHPKRRAVSH